MQFYVNREEYHFNQKMTNDKLTDLDKKIDELTNLLNQVSYEIDTKINSVKIEKWQFIATNLITFLIGGGFVALLEFLR